LSSRDRTGPWFKLIRRLRRCRK